MSIREIPAAAITDAVEALCIEANTQLPADVKAALDKAEANEPWPLALQRTKTCPSARTPAWPASLLSWVRTPTSTVI